MFWSSIDRSLASLFLENRISYSRKILRNKREKIFIHISVVLCCVLLSFRSEVLDFILNSLDVIRISRFFFSNPSLFDITQSWPFGSFLACKSAFLRVDRLKAQQSFRLWPMHQTWKCFPCRQYCKTAFKEY